METQKIAVACFVGGAVCCVVALMFAPVYWWLGLIAGLAGGYISHEFRELREAIPIAFRAACKGGASAWDNMIAAARKWLSQPHPFFYCGMVLVVSSALLFGIDWPINMVEMEISPAGSGKEIPILHFVILVEMAIFLSMFFASIAYVGARCERCYWYPFYAHVFMGGAVVKERIAQLEAKGRRRVRMSYANALRWTAKGVGIIILCLAWTLWRYLAIGIWKGLCLFGRFAWHFFKLIHSEKRVLCAIDGTLGGAVAYIWLASSTTTFAEQMMLVVFGGLIGAAFGIANWEIVSKRLLRVTASTL